MHPSPRIAAKAAIRGLDLMGMLELILDTTVVERCACANPCHDRTITKNGSKRAGTPLDLLDIFQLVLHGTAVTSISSIGSRTPGHDGSIAKNGSKSSVTGLDLLHILQLILDSTTVTTSANITP